VNQSEKQETVRIMSRQEKVHIEEMRNPNIVWQNNQKMLCNTSIALNNKESMFNQVTDHGNLEILQSQRKIPRPLSTNWHPVLTILGPTNHHRSLWGDVTFLQSYKDATGPNHESKAKLTDPENSTFTRIGYWMLCVVLFRHTKNRKELLHALHFLCGQLWHLIF